MAKYCDNVRRQPFTYRWSQTGKDVKMFNIIGEQNWQNAKIRVLLLAHWDTRPTADMETDNEKAKKPILGANDGASGVAVLLELMRVLKGYDLKDVGIMYLMTDGEDLGPELDEMFLGARYFARNLPNPRPHYGILLDMIGDKDLSIPREPNSAHFAPDLVKAFFLHAHSQGFRNTYPMGLGPIIEDDHMPLNQAGLPTMDLIDFDYPYWHTHQDTIDKCSPDSLYKVGAVLETWLTKAKPWVPPGVKLTP